MTKRIYHEPKTNTEFLPLPSVVAGARVRKFIAMLTQMPKDLGITIAGNDISWPSRSTIALLPIAEEMGLHCLGSIREAHATLHAAGFRIQPRGKEEFCSFISQNKPTNIELQKAAFARVKTWIGTINTQAPQLLLFPVTDVEAGFGYKWEPQIAHLAAETGVLVTTPLDHLITDFLKAGWKLQSYTSEGIAFRR